MVDYGHTWFQSTKSLVLLFLSLDTSRLYWVSLPVSVSVMEVKPLVSKKAIVPLKLIARVCDTLEATGQCLAHFIMGSSFVAYGILLLLSLRVGGPWLLRQGKSQEWYDSWVIMLWGIVNTFTEHR